MLGPALGQLLKCVFFPFEKRTKYKRFALVAFAQEKTSKFLLRLICSSCDVRGGSVAMSGSIVQPDKWSQHKRTTRTNQRTIVFRQQRDEGGEI